MFPIKKLAARLIFSLIASFSFGQSLITAVPIANYPQALAVNAFTNRVYVLEESANQVTEIDGLTNAAVTIPLGTNSQSSLNGALAINPITNTIYAVDGVNNHLSIIDGATRVVTQIIVGNAPVAVSVNPSTNTIYVANEVDNTVTVVNGKTLATSTVAVGTGPTAMAIDSSQNKVYVANFSSSTVTIIDFKSGQLSQSESTRLLSPLTATRTLPTP
jgi:YVTN family beta-propeller protein